MEIRENQNFMRARSLSEAEIDSIIQGILDVNSQNLKPSDLAEHMQDLNNQEVN